MNKKPPKISKIALAAIFMAVSAGDAAAASPDVTTFRADYGAVLDGLETSLNQNGNARGLKLLRQSRTALNSVSNDNLARVFEGGLPDISGSLAEMRSFSSKSVRAKSAGLPAAAGIHSACDSNPHDSDSVYAALIASQVTSSILSAATFVCTQDILGENGSAVCIPFAIADDIAQGIFAVRSWCAGEEGGAKSDASYERLGHIHDDLADARATILTDSSSHLTSILGNTNANTLAINNNIASSTSSIINSGNVNTSSILANGNTNTASIIANNNANTTTTNNNINANTTSIINNENHNRDVLVGELRALACEIVRLLNTPDGQRSSAIQACSAQAGFPYSWNKK